MLRFCLLGIVFSACMVGRAAAQPVGDSNGDGAVNGTDFLALQSCLTGPAVMASGVCATSFDTIANGMVDLEDFLLMQQAAAGLAGTCTRAANPANGLPLNQYVGAGVAPPPGLGVLGTYANLNTIYGTLCTAANSSVRASVSWTGVAQEVNGQIMRSAQIGLATGQNYPATGPYAGPPPNPTGLFTKAYMEVIGRPNDSNYYYREWADTPPPGSTNRYICEFVEPSLGLWSLYAEDDFGVIFGVSLIPSSPIAQQWRNQMGNSADWLCEMFNREDKVAGTPSTHLQFRSCEWLRTDFGGVRQGVGFTPGFVTDPNPAQQGDFRRSQPQSKILWFANDANGFDVWYSAQ